jgi:uncharacterized membrane protein YcjF (UPF0283 family)
MKPILKTLERIAVIVGVALIFFAVLESIRAYDTLRGLHPWAGYGFLALAAAALFYLVWQFRALALYRTALRPPVLPDEGELTRSEVKRSLRYLDRVTARFEANPLLQGERSTSETAELRAAVNRLQADPPSPESGLAELHRIENEYIAPLLRRLDRTAESIVSDNVGLVTLGTALSPYRSIDLYIVLARNARMINRILKVYRTRPSTQETLRVFYDIARVVAAVNLLNAMDNVWAGLGRHVPKMGSLAEAVSEGMFSGLLTSVAGHAAIDRSRSYHPWKREEAARKYLGRLNRWARDVIGILVRHGFDRVVPGRGAGKRTDVNEDLDLDLDAEPPGERETRRWWQRFRPRRGGSGDAESEGA